MWFVQFILLALVSTLFFMVLFKPLFLDGLISITSFEIVFWDNVSGDSCWNIL